MTRFLLAKLHLDLLFDIKLPKDIKIALEKLPKGSEAYDHAYQDAMHRIRSQGPKSVEFANPHHVMDHLCKETTIYFKTATCPCSRSWQDGA